MKRQIDREEVLKQRQRRWRGVGRERVWAAVRDPMPLSGVEGMDQSSTESICCSALAVPQRSG
jgi:hypothetical protein